MNAAEAIAFALGLLVEVAKVVKDLVAERPVPTPTELRDAVLGAVNATHDAWVAKSQADADARFAGE
jgi:hypothetical protein